MAQLRGAGKLPMQSPGMFPRPGFAGGHLTLTSFSIAVSDFPRAATRTW
jgi:hypothetical protein